jgi:hypothetical protein
MLTLSRGKRACAPNVLPVLFWQARQWHIETRTGSPSQVALSWPQLQEATRVVIASGRACRTASTCAILLFA